MTDKKKQDTILIVEDEIELSQIISTWLEDQNYVTQSCASLQEANIRVRNQKYVLIISDIKIQGGSGEELINKLRSDKKCINQDTPIIVISGHLDTKLVNNLKGKVQGGLVKPFELDQILTLVNKVLKK